MKCKYSGFKIPVIVTILVLALVTVLVVINDIKSTSKPTNTDKQLSIEGQPTIGQSDAPVEIVEFGDFKCPACKKWGETIYPQLVADYVETGKAKFSYINVLFHGEESRLASLAAESVYMQRPESYWEFHKALFAEQPDQDHDGLWITNEKINEVAETVPGIDVKQLENDLDEPSVMEEVDRDESLVKEFGIEQTPSVIVNGQMLENPFDYEEIQSLIEEEIEGE
ncbi:DsbA family protein [Terribacillus sp. JSM ZJ617]|uniref:DsbA family protein n=1 Tax=Terribacillus sp. JSM ZJ617 TaxID=3342119 RepID=UPI0035A988CB